MVTLEKEKQKEEDYRNYMQLERVRPFALSQHYAAPSDALF